MSNRKKVVVGLLIGVTAILIFVRSFCGIFVIQPIGAVPDGATIVYWRSGLNLPFVASADGVLLASGGGVSLLGRGLVLAKLSGPILERQIFRVSYSETLYLWSTDGSRFDR